MTLLVEVVASALPERVRAERERRGAVPLGCAVAREEAALEALEAGADEAMVLAGTEPRAIHTLIDRTLLRATMRRQGERLSASVGHAEKLAALGTLVAGVAHEINNPLTVVTLSASMLKRSLDRVNDACGELARLASLGRAVQPEELQPVVEALPRGRGSRGIAVAVDDICEGIDAVTDVVKDLRVFARVDEETPPEWVDIGDLVDQVLRIVRREIERTAVLERDIPADLPALFAPRTRLVQVLTNVLVNAAHAVREVERPIHRVRISARADDEAIVIVVADTGPGIVSADIDRIFDPFFTTKRQDLGTGLGLSISRSILRRLGGDMLVDSVHGDGASFLLMVPLPDPNERRDATVAPRSRHSRPTVRRPVVLVVGADDAMARSYCRALANDYDVVLARDADEAVELLDSGTAADVMLTEGHATDRDGKTITAWLDGRSRPRLIFAASEPTSGESTAPGVQVLAKPVDRDTLLAALERAVDDVD